VKCAGCPFAARPGTCLGIGGRCGGEGKSAATSPAARRRSPPDGPLLYGLVGQDLGLGGAETVDLMIARGVDPARARCGGFVSLAPARAANADASARMAAHAPVGHGLAGLKSLAMMVDVLVSWGVFDHRAAFIGAASRPRIVQIAHFPAEAPFGPATAGMLALVDRWVGVSELAVESMPTPIRASASVIPNAIDPGRLAIGRDAATMRRLWGLPDGVKVAGYLGRLSPEKDPLAMRRLASHLPEGWAVVVVGDGGMKGHLDGCPRLFAVGPDPAAGDCLNAFDTLVVPSHYESYGLTIVEGLWLGIPVVSTVAGMAKLVPGLTRAIPIDADGQTLARAVIEAERSGPMPGSQAWALSEADPDRFGRDWTDLLCSMVAPSTARSSVDPAVRDRVIACPSRGPVLPISMQADCSCRGKEVSECRAGKGTVPGRVTLRDCLACMAV
jgi:glycosyltransferase involved in cell wall biosynthesis